VLQWLREGPTRPALRLECDIIMFVYAAGGHLQMLKSVVDESAGASLPLEWKHMYRSCWPAGGGYLEVL